MSLDAMLWALNTRVGRAAKKLTLIALAERAGTSATAWPSIAWIAEKAELDRKTVISALDSLQESGLISDTGERKGVTGGVKVYKLNMSGTLDFGSYTETVPKTGSFTGETEAVPFFDGSSTVFPGSSTVFPYKQYQKRDTEPVRNHTEPVNEPVKDKLPQGFVDFWNLYPKHSRKGGKANCLKIWANKKLESQAQQILEHLAWQKQDWARSDNKWVQMPSSYLNDAKWDGWENVTPTRKDRGVSL